MVLSLLTVEEQRAMVDGRWLSQLPRSSQHALLSLASVRRYEGGQQIAACGRSCTGLLACASGAIHVSTTTANGAVLAVNYVRPGVWLCAAGVLEGATCSHDVHARGDVTLLSVAADDLRTLLAGHPEFYGAVMQLHARQIRRLFTRIEDLSTLRLRARLSKQLLGLARGFGVPSKEESEDVRIGLNLSQTELGQLVGASRQRVNLELKKMEQEGVIYVSTHGLIVRDSQALEAIGYSESTDR